MFNVRIKLWIKLYFKTAQSLVTEIIQKETKWNSKMKLNKLNIYTEKQLEEYQQSKIAVLSLNEDFPNCIEDQ